MEHTFTPELKKRLIVYGVVASLIIVLGGVAAYMLMNNRSVYIDTASITAPTIMLGPTSAGRLNAVYVQEGDTIAANTPVAEIGTEIVTSKVAGIVTQVNDTVGAAVTPGTDVVSMIDPSQLRVVGKIDEDKGLADIAVGDAVVFTADAFGGTQFKGVVDEVAPTSNTSDIVFSVSDARAEQSFSVKARFDTVAYPQLKNGMSARMWVYR